MLTTEEKTVLFENARLTFYSVLVVAGVIACKLPFQYLCDYEGYSCIFCGMRQAVDYVLAADFQNAVLSNPLVLCIGVVAADMLYILIKKVMRKNFKKTGTNKG